MGIKVQTLQSRVVAASHSGTPGDNGVHNKVLANAVRELTPIPETFDPSTFIADNQPPLSSTPKTWQEFVGPGYTPGGGRGGSGGHQAFS